MDDLAQNIVTLSGMVRDPYLKKMIDEMQAKVPFQIISNVRPFSETDMIDSDFIKANHDALVRLNSKLKSSLLELKRAEIAWE